MFISVQEILNPGVFIITVGILTYAIIYLMKKLLFIIMVLFLGVQGVFAEPQTKTYDYYLTKGYEISEQELGRWDLFSSYGRPKKKDKAIVWGADGLKHQIWRYPSRGVNLLMTKFELEHNECVILNKKMCVFGAEIRTPSNFKTLRNVGIGSSYNDVVKAYKKEIDFKNGGAGDDSLVVGTVYGGIIFNFTDKKVDFMFIGSYAE